MNTEIPWNGIDTPVAGYLWKRHSGSARHVFWWGKDHLSRPVMLFQLSNSDHLATFRHKSPRVAGLEIDIVSVENGKFKGLIISLKTPDADIFHRLCLILISVAEAIQTEQQALASVIAHVERWQDFLAAARRDALTSEEVRGLYAEIVVINDLIDSYERSSSEVISAWGGPLHRPQDFHFSAGYIEVKSVGGRHGDTVSISSEYQLEVESEPFCLVSVELNEDEQQQNALSLNKIVANTVKRLDSDAARIFENRLSVAGYVLRPEYDFPTFRVGKIQIFRVDDSFPAIQAKNLPAAITRVNYQVDLAKASGSLIPRFNLWTSEQNDR